MLKENLIKDDFVLPEKGVSLLLKHFDGEIVELEGHSIVYVIESFEDKGEDVDVMEESGAFGFLTPQKAYEMAQRLFEYCEETMIKNSH